MLVLDNAKVHIIYSSPCIFVGKPTAMRCVNSATAHDGTKNRPSYLEETMLRKDELNMIYCVLPAMVPSFCPQRKGQSS